LFKYDANGKVFAIQRVFLDEEHERRIFHYIVEDMLNELNHAFKKASEK